MRILCALLLATTLLPACGTIMQASNDAAGETKPGGPAVYGGLRMDLRTIREYFENTDKIDGFASAVSGPLMILDLPLSLVADTILLPYSVYNDLDKGGVGIRSHYEVWGDMSFGSGKSDKKE